MDGTVRFPRCCRWEARGRLICRAVSLVSRGTRSGRGSGLRPPQPCRTTYCGVHRLASTAIAEASLTGYVSLPRGFEALLFRSYAFHNTVAAEVLGSPQERDVAKFLLGTA